MKDILKNFIKNLLSRRIRVFAVLTLLILAIVSTGVFAFYKVSKGSTADKASSETDVNNNLVSIDPVVAVVGEEDSSIIGNTASNNSWSGEIISLNNLYIQPEREGTISEWYVRIGEWVRAGQVIGKLSRPPQEPDAIMALSEKLQMLSESRTSTEALRTYTEKRILQLQKLRIDTENSNKQKIDLLRSDTTESGDALLSLIESKKKLAQVILRGSITKTFPMIYGQTNISLLDRGNIPELNLAFGAFSSKLRNSFAPVLFGAWSDLKNTNTVPEKSGLLYFDSIIKLANSSSVDSEMLSETNLDSLKQMLTQDQTEFIMVLGEIKSMELERSDIQRESIDTLSEIDAMIVELEKELAMSEGEVKANEIAYATIRGSVGGGYFIVAPKGGVVSSIMKKPGEFVGPGMPVATVTAGGNDNILIRMRIPNNIQKPEIGEILSIVRPGFVTDVQKARLIGVGSSLDDDGSYMADAVFTEKTKWSIGISVRVLAPASTSAVIVKYSSIFWSATGTPAVWAITEADRIFAKDITIGRTLGSLVEVYTGLQKGDRYITNPTADIKENMFLGDLVKTPASDKSDDDGDEGMGGGMEM